MPLRAPQLHENLGHQARRGRPKRGRRFWWWTAGRWRGRCWEWRWREEPESEGDPQMGGSGDRGRYAAVAAHRGRRSKPRPLAWCRLCSLVVLEVVSRKGVMLEWCRRTIFSSCCWGGRSGLVIVVLAEGGGVLWPNDCPGRGVPPPTPLLGSFSSSSPSCSPRSPRN